MDPTDAACVSGAGGIIDDLRVWNTALQPAAFDVNYKQDIGCAAPNLVANFRFDEGAGQSFASCVGNDTFKIEGTPVWVPRPFP